MILLVPFFVFYVWLLEDPSRMEQLLYLIAFVFVLCHSVAVVSQAFASAWGWLRGSAKPLPPKRFVPVLNPGEQLPDLSKLSDQELDLLASRYAA